MLYYLFQKQGTKVETLAEAFRQFFQSFKKYKEDAPVTDERRQEWNRWLEYLAFMMLNNPDSTDPGLVISKEQAEKLLIEKFGNLYGASFRIEELLKYHLLEPISEKEIGFHHQLIQEYYAAECLLTQLPDLLKKQPEQKYTLFQMNYLNYVKWTEAIVLMVGFPEMEKAGELVELALGVDFKLSARLAGEVKPDFQAETVRIIAEQEIPEWFRIFLLGETKSSKAIDELMQTIKHLDPTIRRRAIWASRQLDIKFAMPLFEKAIKDPDPNVRETTIRAVAELDIEQAVSLVARILPKESVASVREAAVICVLEKSDSESAILALLQATQDTENNVRVMAAYSLEKMNRKTLIPILSKILKNKIIAPNIRKNAAKQLGELGDESVICDLFEAQLDWNSSIHEEAAYALQEIRRKLSKKDTDLEIHKKEDQNKHQIDHWLVYLKSEEPIPRGNAVFHLTSLFDKELAIDLARQALDDPHHYVRGHAISNLVRLIGKEAIPQAIRALDDSHYDVRDQASQALMGLGQNLPDEVEIPEDTISSLIQTLEEEQNAYVRSKTVTTLTNLCCIRPNLLLNKSLEIAFLNASNSSDSFLCSASVRSLGKFSSKRVANKLLQMVGDLDSTVALSATEALKNMPLQVTVQYLSGLTVLVLNSKESFALDAISSIQSRCGFYNYEIYQYAQDVNKLESSGDFIGQLYKDLDRVIYQIERNPELRQQDGEDRLTIEIVGSLRSSGYSANHDCKIGGHVDLTVEKNDFIWLGEAKKYKDNNCLWEGFLQLTTRYSIGNDNQSSGGLLIYIFDEDAKSVMEKWQIYLSSKNLPDYSYKPCKLNSLAFISSHKHQRSGLPFHIKHIPVLLHFSPQDKSRRRSSSTK